MNAEIVTIPAEPIYQLTLTLTKDELQRLTKVCGNVLGGGPTRKILEAIYKAGSDIVGSSSNYGKGQISQTMHFTGE